MNILERFKAVLCVCQIKELRAEITELKEKQKDRDNAHKAEVAQMRQEHVDEIADIVKRHNASKEVMVGEWDALRKKSETALSYVVFAQQILSGKQVEP